MFPASPHGAVCARVLPLVIEANAEALGRDAAANREMLDKYAEVCGSRCLPVRMSIISRPRHFTGMLQYIM
jgi:alcohol dehydrogenase class IV